MCGRLVVVVPDLSVFVLPFGVTRHNTYAWQPRFNLAPTQLAPVVMHESERRLELLRFGLVPPWAAAAPKPKQLINARVETVASLRSFRSALAQRRCVVPVNGYYEWQTQAGRKRPLFIHGATGSTLPLAGVWERWQSHDGSTLQGFAVLTRPAVGFLHDIHARMPLVLPWEHLDAWLDPSQQKPAALEPILQALPEVASWNAHEVAPLVNSADYDAPDCLTPYSSPPPAPDRQLELFASPAGTPRTPPER